MQSSQGTEFQFGRGAKEASGLPVLESSLARSHQWPFHLRIHPNKWEFIAGKGQEPGRWVLEIERCHLRPGVGGVGGKYGPDVLNTLDDTALLQQWANQGDRRWAILPNGDQRLRDGVFGESGNFLRIVPVESVDANGRLRSGQVIIGCWERVTETGKIVQDADALEKISIGLAQTIFRLQGPPSAATAAVQRKLTDLLSSLEATAERSREGGSRMLKRRIAKIRKSLFEITGDSTYADQAGTGANRAVLTPTDRLPVEGAPVPDLARVLASLSPEQIQALVQMATPAPKARKPRQPRKPTDPEPTDSEPKELP